MNHPVRSALSAVRPRNAPVRPAGLPDAAAYGLILTDLPPGARVSLNGVAVQPTADGFVPVLTGRQLLTVVGATEARSAYITLTTTPPRALSVLDVPVTQSVGEAVAPEGDARVELPLFGPSLAVWVDGRRRVSVPRDATSGIYTVRVPAGVAALRVIEGQGSSRQGQQGEITLQLEPGEVRDVNPDELRWSPAPSVWGQPIPTEGGLLGPVLDLQPTPTPTQAPTPPLTTASPASPTPTQAPTSESPVVRRLGLLKVMVNVAGATVSLNGVPLQGPPFERQLGPGTYELVVEASGYVPHIAEVRIDAEDVTTARVTLDPVPARRAPSGGHGLAVSIGAVLLVVGGLAAWVAEGSE